MHGSTGFHACSIRLGQNIYFFPQKVSFVQEKRTEKMRTRFERSPQVSCITDLCDYSDPPQQKRAWWRRHLPCILCRTTRLKHQ
jgi:hypothetical protein